MELEQMFRLLHTYFEAVSESGFQQDLRAKDYVILLRDEANAIQGFSTGQVLEYSADALRARAIFSGDTIIHRDYWGELTLPLAFAKQAGHLKALRPDLPLYWFLITKGYRTYRYLPLFFHDFHPRWDREAPDEAKTLLDAIARQKFGPAYHADTGVIRFPQSQGHLREEWAGVRDAILRKPDVRFFFQRNPGYRAGDELACLAELSLENIRPIAQRAFLEGMRPDA